MTKTPLMCHYPREVRTIAVLSTGRQDWGILRSTCAALRASSDFRLALVAGGMACSERFGLPTRTMREDGFEIASELDWLGGAGRDGVLAAARGPAGARRHGGRAPARRGPG